ncbi:MAG TPA: GNAT family N-acetyltransferase, partial [Burkholderiales bacterium]|nr:GNAT family N-acetyltransferase [Burkholderiales bacterium]
MQLRTPRVLLRRWRSQDIAPLAALNADLQVMEYFPAPLTEQQSASLIGRAERDFERFGFGLWALELPGEEPLIGFLGLMPVPDGLPFAPAVEVGWRLASRYWGRGLATEAGREVARYAFEQARLPELVAYTATQNDRSRRLMRRLGMIRAPGEDFAHPAVAP